MSTTWRNAYDKQVELWRWWERHEALLFANGYMASVGETGNGAKMAGAALRRGQSEIMLYADPIAVDEDMMTLVEHAAQTFEPEPLLPTDLITPVGFVWLPWPIVVTDVHNKRMAYRAMAWGPVEFRGVDSEGAQTGKVEQGLMTSFYSWHHDGPEYDDYSKDMLTFQKAYGTDLSMAHWEPWIFGEDYSRAPGTPGRTDIGLRFLHTLFRIMQQTISVRTETRPDRAARRRAAREAPKMVDKYITVITLRRPKAPAEEGAEPRETNWTHRWLVRGFWRNQWFPSISVHRRIWINPFVKGPGDLPLRISHHRAFELKQ